MVVGGEREGLLEGLGGLARGASMPGVIEGVASVGSPAGGAAVFLFPGQGSQWKGMALELLGSSPVFAEHMRVCGEALAKHVDWSLEDVLRGGRGAPGLERVDVVQPVLFAVMVSLAECWRACGVRPAGVVGHSQGEIAAAYVAGGLSLEDAVRVIALRSRLLSSLVGKGGIVSVALGVQELGRRLERWGDRVAISAVNGPSSAGVSGDPQALEELLGNVRPMVSGRGWCRLPLPRILGRQRLCAKLLDVLCEIAPCSGDVPFFSTVTGGLLDTSELDGDYWYRNMRETVQFEQVMRALLTDGARVFIEVSPHPVLTVGAQETVDDVLSDPGDALVVGSLRRTEGGPVRFLTSLAEVWVRGMRVNWGAVFQGSGVQRVRLPSYAFQREHYWLQAQAGVGNMASVGQVSAGHPLLGALVRLADDRGWAFTGRVSLESHPWLADHVVLGVVLLPGTAFLELALHVGGQVGCRGVGELILQAPLVLDEQGAAVLQVSVGELDGSVSARWRFIPGWKVYRLMVFSLKRSGHVTQAGCWSRRGVLLLVAGRRSRSVLSCWSERLGLLRARRPWRSMASMRGGLGWVSSWGPHFRGSVLRGGVGKRCSPSLSIRGSAG